MMTTPETETARLDRLCAIACAALEDIKANDIMVLDTASRTPLFSRMIVAGADSMRQVRALAIHVAAKLKEAGFEVLSSEGLDGSEWALVDAGDLVVHVMMPEPRAFYDIETLWGGKRPSEV